MRERDEVFDKTRYLIEGKLAASFLKVVSETYSIKDDDGNVLGYAKKTGDENFEFERTDGVRLGEIRGNGEYKIYDDRNRIQATIRMAPKKKEESRKFLLALFLAFMPMGVFLASLALCLAVPSFCQVFTERTFVVFLFSCLGLTFLGLILFGYFAHKGRFGRPKWLIGDSKGGHLAEGSDFWLGRHVQIKGSDGGIIAKIEKKRGLAGFRDACEVEILQIGFNALLILSYTVLIIHRAKVERESAFS